MPANCFFLINSTCWDCRRDAESGPECRHNYFGLYPQHLSGHFSFCSGHAAASAEEMSYVAWMRLIDWRSDNCDGAFERTAWAWLNRDERKRSDAHWLRYYEKATSRWGWQQGIEVI